MRMNPRAYFALFLLIVASIVIIISSTYSYFHAKLLPLIVGSMIFILALTELRNAISTDSKKSATAKEEPEKIIESRTQLGRFVSIMAWVVGFCLSIYLFGFIISIPLFSLSYMRMHGQSWLKSLGYAVILTAVIYFGFQWALKYSLYKGLFFSLRR